MKNEAQLDVVELAIIKKNEWRVRAVELDERGRVARYQVAELEPVELSYHPAGEPGAGKLASLVEGEGDAARRYELSYDQRGDLETITDPLGRTVSFGRDEAGRVTSQTLPDGRVVMYGYDENGNVTSVTPPGRPDHGFSYNALDGQESYEPPPPEAEDPGSYHTTYRYNREGQLVSVARPDGRNIELSYDAAGRLVQVALPFPDKIDLGYNPDTGQLESIDRWPNDVPLRYEWNGMLLSPQSAGRFMIGLGVQLEIGFVGSTAPRKIWCSIAC